MLYRPQLRLPGFSAAAEDSETQATYVDQQSSARPSARPSLALFTDDMNDADLAASYEV